MTSITSTENTGTGLRPAATRYAWQAHSLDFHELITAYLQLLAPAPQPKPHYLLAYEKAKPDEEREFGFSTTDPTESLAKQWARGMQPYAGYHGLSLAMYLSGGDEVSIAIHNPHLHRRLTVVIANRAKRTLLIRTTANPSELLPEPRTSSRLDLSDIPWVAGLVND